MRNIELVKWLDPHTDTGWHTGDNGVLPEECYSVGVLISEYDLYIVLAADWSGEETNTRLIIPKGAIVSRTEICRIE
jgi:hypothetical protein